MKDKIQQIIKDIDFDLQDNTTDDLYGLFNELYIQEVVKFYPQLITTPSGYDYYIQIACHEWTDKNTDTMIILDCDPKSEYENIDELLEEIERLNNIRNKYDNKTTL